MGLLFHACLTMDIFGFGSASRSLPLVYASICVLVVGFAGVIVGIVGAAEWGSSGVAEREARGPVACEVMDHLVKTYTCTDSDCTGTTDDESCTYTEYTCYGVVWEVKYDALSGPEEGDGKSHRGLAEDDHRRLTKSATQKDAEEHEIGKSYDCWYQLTDYTRVSWEKPDGSADFIMMIVGFSLAVPGFLYYCCFCSYRTIDYFRSGKHRYGKLFP